MWFRAVQELASVCAATKSENFAIMMSEPMADIFPRSFCAYQALFPSQVDYKRLYNELVRDKDHHVRCDRVPRPFPELSSHFSTAGRRTAPTRNQARRHRGESLILHG